MQSESCVRPWLKRDGGGHRGDEFCRNGRGRRWPIMSPFNPRRPLPVVAVVNRKGGSGKSTLATHLAAYLARRGTPVMLGDVDRQQSTVPWLRRRAARALPWAPIVAGRSIRAMCGVRRPGFAHVCARHAGRLRGFDLSRLLMHVDAVLSRGRLGLRTARRLPPAWPNCVRIRVWPAAASRVAAVGVRIDARTRAEQGLREWAARPS